jgi:hypothetical protein
MMLFQYFGAPGRNRTGTPVIHEATDFKSGVSTSFTTGAEALLCLDKTTLPTQLPCKFSMASAYKATTAK